MGNILLHAADGRNVYAQQSVEELRSVEEEKRKKKVASRTFISQKGAQEHVQHSCADVDGTGGNRGGGKANTYNTLVATPSGFRRMGELEVGDYICTPYEGIQQVSAIFEQGEQTTYTLFFDDGSSLKCMDNHRFWGRETESDRFRLWEAREIFDIYRLDKPYPYSLRNKHLHMFEIPLCGEVEFNSVPDAKLPIDPFFLGYILGQGTWEADRGGIIIPKTDRTLNIIARSRGLKIGVDNNGVSRRLRGISPKQRREIFNDNLWKKGFATIPDSYMLASPKARWDFLAGMMKRNGRSWRKHPIIEMANKILLEQVAQLARSLGIWARVAEVNDDPTKVGYWRLMFIAPDDRKFFTANAMYISRAHIYGKLPTKRPEGYDETVLTKKIMWIRKDAAKSPCRCITITGNEHLYLTDAFTINHNTAMLLTKPLPDITNKYFNGIIFRKNKGDFENIIGETRKWYEPLGKYNRSSDDMTWYFHSGAKLSLSYFDMAYQDFDDRYRGQQFAYIGIDEVPQMSFKMFKFLTTVNRNTNNIKSRILFTCNPDPLSWLRRFLDWYIGKADTIYADGKLHPERKGFIIPERSGKTRYFYSPDDNVENIIWGNTPREVYLQIKDIADEAWSPSLAQFGHTRETFLVKSFRFTKADLLDNKALMALDEDYIKNLYQQPPEIRARELEGNWDIVRTGNDLIQAFHLDKCFHNAAMLGDKVKRASCDVAGDGGDNCVTWFKVGNHVQDVFVCRRDPYSTIPLIKAKLKEWGVLEQNFTYDLQGMGQVFKGAFPNAVPFNNQEAPDYENRKLYNNIKSQCAYTFAQHTQQGEWSIEPSLLDREFIIGKTTMRLYTILQTERKAIRQDMSKQDRGWCLIHKEQMKHKSLVGHSPDFIEALLMFEIFEVKGEDSEIPSFLGSHIANVRTFDFA